MRKIFLFTGVVAFTILFASSLAAQKVKVVNDCNLEGWLKQPIGSSSLGFVKGPEQPPLGRGSMKFNVPEGGIFWPGDFVRFRNGDYSGTPLSSLTKLSYSTYVEARDTIADIHFLVVLVDINGDSTAEHNLVFDPRYQNQNFIRGTMPNQGFTRVGVWQNWDALHAGWFYGGTPETDPDHEGPFFTLAEYLAQYPNAAIRNDPNKGGPAIRLTAGGVVFKPNFFGSIDNFRIGVNGATTIYDFEPGPADAGADQHVIYGYGSNCVLLHGRATGDAPPYNFAWSPGNLSQGNHIKVCPTSTTTYTLTVTDKNCCVSTDEMTVHVQDVRCGPKLDKVLICHNGREICVAREAVAAHLKHGDGLGKCEEKIIVKDKDGKSDHHSRDLKLFNYPNPFAHATEIVYEMPFDGHVRIRLFDIAGRERRSLVSGFRKHGRYSINISSKGLANGVYYYKMVVTSGHMIHSTTARMVISK